MRRWIVLALGAGLPVLGCDGLGRKIVDRFPEREPLGAGCGVPVQCAAPLTAMPRRPLSPAMSALEGCPQPLAESLGLAEADQSCTRVTMRSVSAPALVRGAVLRNAELIVERGDAELAGVALRDVVVQLRAGSRLRIVEGSQLERVRVLSAAEPGARFELVESDATELTLAGEQGSFRGTSFVTRSELHGATLTVDDLSIENTRLTDVAIVALRFASLAAEGRGIQLDVERGSIAAGTLDELNVVRCGSLQIASCSLADLSLMPCAEPLRISHSRVTRGFAAGAIQSKLTVFSELAFGAGFDTSLELWRGTLTRSTLCEGVREVAFSSKVTCNVCPEQVAPVAPFACWSGERDADVREEMEIAAYDPDCTALDVALPCDPPLADGFPF